MKPLILLIFTALWGFPFSPPIFFISALSSSPSSSNRRRGSSAKTRSSDESREFGPRSESRRHSRIRRTSGRTRVPAQEHFDPKYLTRQQNSNEDANPLDLYNTEFQNIPTFIKRISSPSANQVNSKTDVIVSDSRDGPNTKDNSAGEECKGPEICHSHVEYLSLDDLFPNLNFGKAFFTNGEFRRSLRVAMRKDVFFTTPAYAELSPKIAAMMLDDDSSLQGTWNCIPKNVTPEMMDGLPLRMSRLTKVLQDYLGTKAPTGDDFMITLGGLCGENPKGHWIDIIGVKDRILSHSWHQDTGVSYKGRNAENSRYTVMLGFPIEDEYSGCGVFSHTIKLEREHLAPDGHKENEPVLFEGTAKEEYITRPAFSLGKEIIRYRDTDVLHSAPDVAYRQSVMRYM
eukprot:scaffold2192_cov268-Chaetoceros_neogracile.AAC.53